MIVGAVRVAEPGVLHQAGEAAAQGRAGAVPGDDVLDALAELEGPGFGRGGLGEAVAMAEHGVPDVAGEVVDGAAGAEEEVVLGA